MNRQHKFNQQKAVRGVLADLLLKLLAVNQQFDFLVFFRLNWTTFLAIAFHQMKMIFSVFCDELNTGIIVYKHC